MQTRILTRCKFIGNIRLVGAAPPQRFEFPFARLAIVRCSCLHLSFCSSKLSSIAELYPDSRRTACTSITFSWKAVYNASALSSEFEYEQWIWICIKYITQPTHHQPSSRSSCRFPSDWLKSIIISCKLQQQLSLRLMPMVLGHWNRWRAVHIL